MRAFGVTLDEVFTPSRCPTSMSAPAPSRSTESSTSFAASASSRTLEDIEDAVVKVNDNVPIYVRNVANVTLGPGLRRGVSTRPAPRPSAAWWSFVTARTRWLRSRTSKRKIAEISPGLPKKTLSDGTVSQVQIVPFYDRTGLIYETLGTLGDALLQQILVTIIVVVSWCAICAARSSSPGCCRWPF